MDAGVLLLVTAAVSTAVTAGVFVTFSTVAMRALGDLPPADALRAMQAVNRRALTPVFLSVVLGSALLAAASGVRAVLGDDAGGAAGAAGGVLGVAALAVTVAVNVPLTERLARDDAAAPDAPEVWAAHARRWTRANHLRAALALAAAVLLTLGARAAA